MEDTASLVQSAVADATTIADTEPIPGDESPDAAVEGSEPAPAEAAEPESGKVEPESGTPAPPKRRGSIPLDRHQAVLTKARNEAAKAREELQKQLEETRTKYSKYDSEDHQAQLKFLELLENDTPRAVAILKQIDPQRFGKLSWAEQQAAAEAVGDALAGGTPAAAVGEKPRPDALNAEGQLVYSAEAAEKLVEWRVANERAAYQKELKALREELTKDIAPIKQEREAREAFGKATERQKPLLENARKSWKGFIEHEPAIREYLAKNDTAGLHDAYIAVVVPKLEEAATNAEATARKKVIGELNTKGKATGVIPGKLPAAASADGDSGEPKSTADLVRAAIRAAA